MVNVAGSKEISKVRNVLKDSTNSEKKPTTAPVPAPAPASPRRGPGAKEVIPFEWKLLGESRGLTLTLFKAVERAEVEAQLDRLQKDGYYKKLRILDNKTKVKQSASVQRVPIRPGEKAKPKTRKKTKAARGSTSKSLKIKTAKARSTQVRITTSKTAKGGKVTKAAKTSRRAAAGARTVKSKSTTSKKRAARSRTTKTAKKNKTAKRTKPTHSVKTAKSTKPARSAKAARKQARTRTTKTAKKKAASSKSTRRRTMKKK